MFCSIKNVSPLTNSISPFPQIMEIFIQATKNSKLKKSDLVFFTQRLQLQESLKPSKLLHYTSY